MCVFTNNIRINQNKQQYIDQNEQILTKKAYKLNSPVHRFETACGCVSKQLKRDTLPPKAILHFGYKIYE